MRRSLLFGAIAAGLSAVPYAAYRKAMHAAKLRTRTGRRVVDAPGGPIEFGESGVGPAVLFIHGAGGGFDQGLDVARVFLGDDYRVIAPSRFGYLGTPLPDDATPEAQADAHVRLLDALHLDRVSVIGISAGGPSAMQFALRHADRCSALALLVPLAYAPNRAGGGKRLRPLFATVLNTLVSSDFAFWTATKLAHSTLIETLLGTPFEVYRNATPEIRRGLDQMLMSILPVSKRAKGIENDKIVSANLTRYALEDLRVPLLAISASDDGYGTFDSARYTAQQCNGTFLGFESGGHLLVGHDAQVRLRISAFLAEHHGVPERPAVVPEELAVEEVLTT